MLRISACCLLIAAGALLAQSQAKSPVFEAASIKPTAPSVSGSHWNSTKGRVSMGGQTLKRLVMIAYDLKQYQIEGGPKWFDSERFDINAKLEEADAKSAPDSDDPLKAALANLLAER